MREALRSRVGELLVVGGVLAWVPYFALQLDPAREVPILPFLVAHLSGVVPGAALLGRGRVSLLLRRLASGVPRGREGNSTRT